MRNDSKRVVISTWVSILKVMFCFTGSMFCGRK